MVIRVTSCIRHFFLLGLIPAVLLSGCGNFHSLYFVRSDRTETRIDRYRLTPRIFAYQEMQTTSKTAHLQPFAVTVRVDDVVSEPALESWRVGQDVINSASDGFLARAREVFVVDSFALHQVDTDNERLVLIPDSANFTPRRENYFTLRFGDIELPPETGRLRAVLHYARVDDADIPVGDSVVWTTDLVKTSRRGVRLGASTIRGYD